MQKFKLNKPDLNLNKRNLSQIPKEKEDLNRKKIINNPLEKSQNLSKLREDK